MITLETTNKLSKSKQNKQTRIIRTMELFVEKGGNITDQHLALLLQKENINSSSSTVGRDLTINIRKLFLDYNKDKNHHNDSDSTSLTKQQAAILAFIIQKRKQNKHKGQIKGGSMHKNNY